MKLNFQTILLGVLGIAIVVAIGIFAGSGGSDSAADNKAKVVRARVWSTFPSDGAPGDAFSAVNQRNYKTLSMEYVYKDPATFMQDFVEVLATDKTTGSNNAPDLLLIRNDQVLALEKFIVPTPYTEYPLQTFNQQYVAGANGLLGRNGVLALPLLLDPVVLYSHKDLLTNASIITPPKYWDEIPPLQELLTKRSGNSFSQSMISLGSYENITHAKDIFSTMLLQSGVPILARKNGILGVDMTAASSGGEQPAASILRFWSDFANPLKTSYSWNALAPQSLNAFATEKLALYPGVTSDYTQLKKLNSHLNFGVSQIPQFRGSTAEITGGVAWGLAVVQKGKQASAGKYAKDIVRTDPLFLKEWSLASMLPPARIDMLAKKPADPILATFYDSALRMRTWLDPDAIASDASFGAAITGIASGRFTPSTAVSSINSALNEELAKLK